MDTIDIRPDSLATAKGIICAWIWMLHPTSSSATLLLSGFGVHSEGAEGRETWRFGHHAAAVELLWVSKTTGLVLWPTCRFTRTSMQSVLAFGRSSLRRRCWTGGRAREKRISRSRPARTASSTCIAFGFGDTSQGLLSFASSRRPSLFPVGREPRAASSKHPRV